VSGKLQRADDPRILSITQAHHNSKRCILLIDRVGLIDR
jgi:hypothetical protein